MKVHLRNKNYIKFFSFSERISAYFNGLHCSLQVHFIWFLYFVPRTYAVSRWTALRVHFQMQFFPVQYVARRDLKRFRNTITSQHKQ